MNLLDFIKTMGLNPKRKASCHGGEYCSPCVFCKEGIDRFLIWPNRLNNNGSYHGGRFRCRKCGKHGDAIQFLCSFHGLTYLEACSQLKIEPKYDPVILLRCSEEKFAKAEEPSIRWQSQATAFVDWCHDQLTKTPQALNLLYKRGFTLEAISQFKLGFNPQNYFRSRSDWGLSEEIKDNGKPRKQWLPQGIVIPTYSYDQKITKIKIRRSAWQKDDNLPKYVEISGSKKCPSIFGNIKLKTCLILESELDALLIQQFASDLLFCIALGGSTRPIDWETDQLLRTVSLILFCPDFDEAGAKAWLKWKKMFRNIKKILPPQGKAPGDALLEGVNLRGWLEANLNI